MGKHDPPKGIRGAGPRLWLAVLDDYELEEHELLPLREIVRTVDTLDALAECVVADGVLLPSSQGECARPALVEARQQRRMGVRGVYGIARRNVVSGDEPPSSYCGSCPCSATRGVFGVMTKPLRCRFGRHRWFSVGMSDNGAIIWRCQACGKTTKRGNTPDFPGDIVP